jgi:hypothetical protein
MTARTREVLVYGTRYFRVLAGPFYSLATAKAKKSELAAARISDEPLFIQDLN